MVTYLCHLLVNNTQQTKKYAGGYLLKNFIKKIKLPTLLEILKWNLIDMYRFYKNKDRQKSFVKETGIYILTGQTGGGKSTLSVKLIDDLISKYGRENLLICSNTNLVGQDFKVTHWMDLTLFYNKPLIFLYDECNQDFGQFAYRDAKGDSEKMRTALTQNRKGNGKKILAISQDYNMLANDFRRLAKRVYWCKTIFGGRYSRAKIYDTMEYEQMINDTDINKKMKAKKLGTISVVQTDEFRQKYESFALIESIKKPLSEYKIRPELLQHIDTRMNDLNNLV